MRVNNYKTVLDTRTHMAYLVQEKGFNYSGMPDRKCNCAELVVDMMRICYGIHNETEECVYLLCLDTNCKLIGTFLISRGTVNTSLVSPREVMIKALLCNSVNIVMVHNHPSQVKEPSLADMQITERIRQAGDIVGLSLLDHIIVCADTYYSFKEHGHIEK